MSKITIIIEISEIDISDMDDKNVDAFRLSVQLMRDGHIVRQNSIGCYASRIYSLIGTWLASVKHELIP